MLFLGQERTLVVSDWNNLQGRINLVNGLLITFSGGNFQYFMDPEAEDPLHRDLISLTFGSMLCPSKEH